jgi:hypothetical protein
MMPTTRRDFLQGSVALAALPYLTLPLTAQTPAAAEELWYWRPAERWLEALPVGNGRLGGMVFGGNANALRFRRVPLGPERQPQERSIRMPCRICLRSGNSSSTANTTRRRRYARSICLVMRRTLGPTFRYPIYFYTFQEVTQLWHTGVLSILGMLRRT